MELLRSHGGQELFARAMLTDERFFLTTLRLAAEDDPGQEKLPSVDLKILAFINAMSLDERKKYAEKGELPQAVVSRVNAKLAEATWFCSAS